MRIRTVAAALSVAMWSGALFFSPAPANATYVAYPSLVNYFSCSIFQSSLPMNCNFYQGEEGIVFTGTMRNTIPLSGCGGSCSGTLSLTVEDDIGNGRVQCDTSEFIQCGGSYAYPIYNCNGC